MATVVCPIEIPDGCKVVDCAFHSPDENSPYHEPSDWRGMLRVQWVVEGRTVYTAAECPSAIEACDPARWQDMLEQVQIYVRMKEKKNGL